MAANDALSRLAEQSEPASAGQLASFSNIASALEGLQSSKDLSERDQKLVGQLADAFTTMHQPAQAAEEQPTAGDTAPETEAPGDDTTAPRA